MGGRSWFFTLVGHKVFHVKFLCSLFSHYLPTVESRSGGKINQSDCSRKLRKNTIHPPLVSCTLKSSLTIVQYRIHLDENANYYCDTQGRLNLTLQGIVRNDILSGWVMTYLPHLR